ncbi:hypothetical protein CU102_08430 [Phyllobacterium brassicacearum]|uniref:Uncharacterized protein n=1 Tax=Phyllobacterium brassicacearum TaxID=314235 RepID=A0A2P7BSG0_9HYPH|nr:hypothetical protein [Phyllobacterium brassicacearum]PSH69400.1 hypothetical protein CU102_08430 [Phyllobacterium brassicacearum]TDQ34426.1 hypothetical protein DEV91_103158 [Phyllobacterium brassicacearum]
MKLTFTNANLKLLWASAEAQWPNGIRPNYVQQGDKDIPLGFWIVGDEGVYLMHNGTAPEGTENTVT